MTTEIYNNLLPKRIYVFFQSIVKLEKDNKLEFEFLSLLEAIKLNLETKNYYYNFYVGYLIFIIKLMALIRDYEFGYGNLNLFIKLLYTLHSIFPSLALKLLENCFSIDKKLLIGSWKDIKYLCEFVKNKTHNELHPLITKSIDLVVIQLKLDASKSNEKLSLVAKWIPREKSKYGWLFDLIAKRYYHYYFNYINNVFQEQRALSKASRNLRKTCSKLNEKLQVLENKLCNNHKEINISKLTKKNISQYISLLTNKFSIVDQLSISQTMFWQDIILKAWKICDQKQCSKEVDFLNNQWEIIESSISSLINILPIVDCSFEMGVNNFIRALGLGIMIANKSQLGNRIVLINNKFTWISFENCKRLTDKLKVIKSKTQMINSNLNCGYNSLCREIFAFGDKKNIIKDLNLLVLTNGVNADVFEVYKDPNYVKTILWFMEGNNKTILNNVNNLAIISGDCKNYINFFWEIKGNKMSIELTEDWLFVKNFSKVLMKPKFLQLDNIIQNGLEIIV